jgi:hypothetical protein
MGTEAFRASVRPRDSKRSSRDLSSSRFDSFCHVFFQLRDDVRELPCNLLLQGLQGIRSTLKHLVRALHRLHKLASEDVGISGVLDVVCDIGRYVYVD